MPVARFSFLLPCLCAAQPALPRMPPNGNAIAARSVTYANLVTKKNELFSFFCRQDREQAMSAVSCMRMPSFRILIRDDEHYSLNIVIDGSRDSVTLKAKDIDLLVRG